MTLAGGRRFGHPRSTWNKRSTLYYSLARNVGILQCRACGVGDNSSQHSGSKPLSQRGKPSKLPDTVTFLNCIRAMPGSNLDSRAEYPDRVFFVIFLSMFRELLGRYITHGRDWSVSLPAPQLFAIIRTFNAARSLQRGLQINKQIYDQTRKTTPPPEIVLLGRSSVTSSFHFGATARCKPLPPYCSWNTTFKYVSK